MDTAQFDLHATIEESHWWFVARRRIMQRLVGELVPPCNGKQKPLVVDVGCGTGANLAALADAYDCVGIDTSTEAVERAQKRFPQVRFVCGFAPHDLGELAAEAKIWLVMDVLEHVEDDFALLSGLMAAAAPGAYFLITVPADRGLWSPHDETFGHYRRYDLERFSQIWADLPAQTRLVSHYNARLCPLVKLVRLANRKLGRASGEAGTDFRLPNRLLNWALARTFYGESQTLVRQLQGEKVRFDGGVSLIAVLQRKTGEIAVRHKPGNLPADIYDPAQGTYLSPVAT